MGKWKERKIEKGVVEVVFTQIPITSERTVSIGHGPSNLEKKHLFCRFYRIGDGE